MSLPAIKKPESLLLALPALAAILLYATSLGFEYVWDDFYYIVERGRVENWSAAWHSALSPFLGMSYYFRPLGILSFAIGGPLIAHAINVGLHAINATLVTGLCRRLQPQAPAWTAVLAGLLYAAHPALIEPVAWISCRFDLLLTCLGLLLLLTQRREPGCRSSLMSAGLFFLAALSKESAVALYPIFLLFAARPQDGMHQRFLPALLRSILRRDSLALVCAGLIYLALRQWALGGLNPVTGVAFAADQHGLLVLKTLGFYTSMMLLPFTQLSPLHLLTIPIQPHDPHVIAGLVTLLGMGMLLWRRPPGWLWLAACLLSLLPVLNLLPLGIDESYAHERLLTLPLAFLCGGAGTLLAQAYLRSRWRLLSSVLAVMWLLAGTWVSCTTLPAWRNNSSLWAWAAQRAPESDVAQNNLLAAFNANGQYEQTLQQARWLEMNRKGELTVIQRLSTSRAWSALNRPQEAMRELDEVVTRYGQKMKNADIADLCGEAAWLLMQAGDLPTARQTLETAVSQGSGDAEAEYHLGAVMIALGHVAQGQPHVEQALAQASPSQRQTWSQGLPALVEGLRQLAQQPVPTLLDKGPMIGTCTR